MIFARKVTKNCAHSVIWIVNIIKNLEKLIHFISSFAYLFVTLLPRHETKRNKSMRKIIVTVAPVCHVGKEIPDDVKNPLTPEEIARERGFTR